MPPGAAGPPRPARSAPRPTRRRLDPTRLPYLVGPGAFAVVVVLMRFGYVAQVGWWVWLTVLSAIYVINVAADRSTRRVRARCHSICG